MDVVGTAIGVVSLAIQLVQTTAKFVQNYKDAPSDVIRFRDQLHAHKDTLIRTQAILIKKDCVIQFQGSVGQAPGQERLDDEWVQSCKDEIERAISALTLTLPRKGLKGVLMRIKTAMTSDKLHQHMTQLHQYCEQINQNVGIDILEVGIESHTLLKETSDALAADRVEERHRAILDWLTPEFQFNRQKDLLAQHHRGTVRWIFQQEEFLDWQSGFRVAPDGQIMTDPSPRIIWYHGEVGVGKSVMMAQVVKALESNRPSDEAVIYIYCNSAAREDQKLVPLLSSLLRQAAERLSETKEFPTELEEIYKRFTFGKTKLDINDVRRLLAKLLVKFRRCFVLVDGLDEYVHSDDWTRQSKSNELLEQINDAIFVSGSACRLFLTSRRYLLPFHDDLEAIRVPIESDEADMRAYLKSRVLDPKFGQSDAVKRDSELLSQIIQKVIQKADKQFLLANLHINELDDYRTVRDLKEALEYLPIRRHDRYHTAMARICKQNTTPKRIHPLGLLVVGFIFHARRPLSVEQLQHALAVREGDTEYPTDATFEKKTILSSGAGLVRISEEGMVGFVHNSVYEFLNDQDQYRTILSSLQEVLVQTCMAYMSLQDFAEPVDDREGRAKQYPLLRYATDFFGNHATACLVNNKALLPCYLDFIRERIQLGVLQEYAARVLQNPGRRRVRSWRNDLSETHLAIVVGLVDVVEMLLDNGADVNEVAFKGETPLHIAARASNKDATLLLLRRGADVHKTSYSGKNALDMIMNEPYLRVEMTLTETNFIDLVLGHLALRFVQAAIKPDNEIDRKVFGEAVSEEGRAHLKKLLKSDKSPEQSKTMTEFTLAANLEMDLTDSQAELVHILIDQGIDLNSEGPALATPLQLAVIYRRKDIVQHLLAKGANPWVDHDLGYNAIELAKHRKDSSVEYDRAAEIEQLVMTKAREIEDLESAEADEDKKAFLPGPAQARRIHERREQTEEERVRRMRDYRAKGTPSMTGAQAYMLRDYITKMAKRAEQNGGKFEGYAQLQARTAEFDAKIAALSLPKPATSAVEVHGADDALQGPQHTQVGSGRVNPAWNRERSLLLAAAVFALFSLFFCIQRIRGY